MRTKECQQCHTVFILLSPKHNNQKFCSKQCSKLANYAKNKERWTRNNQQTSLENSKYSKGKIQCLECKRFFVSPMKHVRYKHNLTAREYKELHGLIVGRGIITDSLRARLQDAVSDNPHVIDNLLIDGAKSRFVKGQKNLGHYIRSEEQKAWLRRHINDIRPTKAKRSAKGQVKKKPKC